MVFARTAARIRRSQAANSGSVAPEGREVPVGLQERLLDQVGRVELPLEPPADLDPGEQGQVGLIPGEEPAERRLAGRPGVPDQPFRVVVGWNGQLLTPNPPGRISAVQVTTPPREPW